jgi:hypothetical protein
LKNVKVILLSNTENLTVGNFHDSQEEVHNPMVLFMDTTTNTVIKHYHVAAKTMERLNLMFKLKYFDTPDLPEDSHEKFGGGYFVGCGPRKEEELEEAIIA